MINRKGQEAEARQDGHSDQQDQRQRETEGRQGGHTDLQERRQERRQKDLGDK